MSILGTLFVVFAIIVLVLVTFIVVAFTSTKNEIYNNVVTQRDALDRLMRETQNADNELQQMTDDELRKRALGRW